MKKKNNKGFMLAETLIVTTFVAGVLIFLFIQFLRLNNSYSDYYAYNTTEDLYALEDIKDYIQSDNIAKQYINDNVSSSEYIKITNCNAFTNKEYCLKLFELENIKKIFVVSNPISIDDISITDETLLKFIRKINNDGNEPYRLIVEFNDTTFATLRLNISLTNNS